MLGTIPACVEDLNMDMLTSVEFQMDSAAYNDQQQVEELLLTPELQEILDRINPDPDALMYTSAAPPGVVFGTLKTASSSAADARIDNSTIAVIPLSVQQQQLDTYHIDAQMTAGQPAEYFTRDYLLPRSSAPMTTTTTSCCPAEGLVQTSPEGTDQTVPFRRHDSACSMISSCSDVMVKRERCSVSTEAESSAPPSSPFAAHSTVAPATTSQLFNHGARRGRPCADHLNSTVGLTDRKLRRREQNRRAATKCRNKRRLEFEQLKKNYDAVMKDNDELRTLLIQLQTQYERLQNEFCRHQQQCGLTLPLSISVL